MLHSSKEVDNGIIALNDIDMKKNEPKRQGLNFRLAGQWCLLSWMKTRVMIGWKTRTWFLLDVDLSSSKSRSGNNAVVAFSSPTPMSQRDPNSSP